MSEMITEVAGDKAPAKVASIPKSPSDLIQSDKASWKHASANTSVAALGGILGFMTLGPAGAVGGALLGAIAAPVLRHFKLPHDLPSSSP